ncbi:sodium-independent anion transporter [Streptomyces sp. AP-93]|uniref:STAS domain-containing protein n=1 Tax=Streptomyces sp. AP-93 TaxID=2929048 RepID=UPI001FAEA63E|nr:sodium-independent anion transporter [Streptomyces sp. AP-93]MCJ0869745.1 STAS domain-containing protein [Streptomyces sp. AP-93]
MGNAFRIATASHGRTVHLMPRGELDAEAGAVFDRLRPVLGAATEVVICDMRGVPFMDVAGLHHLLDFVRTARERGIQVHAWQWQRQPTDLLALIDCVRPPVTAGTADRDVMAGLLRLDVEATAAEGRACGMDVARPPHVGNPRGVGRRTDVNTTHSRAAVTDDSVGRARGNETGGRGSGDDSPSEAAQRS